MSRPIKINVIEILSGTRFHAVFSLISVIHTKNKVLEIVNCRIVGLGSFRIVGLLDYGIVGLFMKALSINTFYSLLLNLLLFI